MRYMPDSAVVGVVTNQRRRNAKARRRNARRNARIAQQNITFGNYVAAIIAIVGFVLVAGLFV